MAAHRDQTHLGPAFLWAAGLNTTYVVVEALVGFWVGSLALLADAAHNLVDVFGVLIAWSAFVIARRRPSQQHTYGLGRATILAALANGVALLIGVGAIVREAIARIAAPEPVAATTILWVAAIVIDWSAFRLFKSAIHLSLDGVPEGIDPNSVEAWLRALPGVTDLHDLHIWAP